MTWKRISLETAIYLLGILVGVNIGLAYARRISFSTSLAIDLVVLLGGLGWGVFLGLMESK